MRFAAVAFAAAAALAPAAAASAQAPSPSLARALAADRHREAIHRMRYRVQDARKPVTAEEVAAIRPVVDALAADLRDSTVPWNGKRPALAALQHLRHAAAPAVPSLVETLDLYPGDDGPQGVGHFCEVTRTLEAVAPQDERGIRAVTEWLQRNTKAHSICHRCGCALKALEAAGPSAHAIATPVLAALAADRVLSSDDWQLGRTLAAIGVSANLSPTLMDRIADEKVSTYDRAEILRALARDASGVGDPRRLLGLAAGLLRHRDRNLREAAAEALGALGPPALDALRQGLGDRDFRVRARAAAALARLGPAAAPAAAGLAEALDPFRGTAREAIAALIAVGDAALPALDARWRAAPGWLQPLIAAAGVSVRDRDPRIASRALAAFAPGPGGHGFVRIEVRRAGDGPVFAAGKHRAHLRVRGGAIGPQAEGLPRFDHDIEGTYAPNTVFVALDGRREGDRLHVVLSPEIAQSPLSGTGRWMREEALKFAVPEGTAAAYDVEIRRVCRPIVWRPIRSGWFSEMKFELACVRPGE
jgi:hypothetical protein